ncbi:MAG: thiamine phosphate synthase [Luteolibacter sp.]|uniref:thiamine phosphate synthase n=1 Tax=Luteolibacter sp. TaxID=1962973 RepID=UPI0032655D56
MNDPRLYCILDLGYTPEESAEEVTASLLAGGADILQLRAKNHDLATIRRVAEKLLPLCRAAGVPFILNDFPALAGEIGADGVHIGQDDGPLADAKHQLERGIHSGLHSFIHPSSSPIPNPQSPISSPFIIGRSTHSLDQARAALIEGFDYIGFGPLFPTPTKAGRPAIGLQEISIMEKEVGSKIPAFYIGGITPGTLPQVLAAGGRRVVVVSALLQAPDIQTATREIRTTLQDQSL